MKISYQSHHHPRNAGCKDGQEDFLVDALAWLGLAKVENPGHHQNLQRTTTGIFHNKVYLAEDIKMVRDLESILESIFDTVGAVAIEFFVG